MGSEMCIRDRYPDDTQPNKFNIGDWTDRGPFDWYATYSQGDVVEEGGYWYTLAKGVTSFRGDDTQGLTQSNYTLSGGQVQSSWSKFDGTEYAFWYRLPHGGEDEAIQNEYFPTGFPNESSYNGQFDLTTANHQGPYNNGWTSSNAGGTPGQGPITSSSLQPWYTTANGTFELVYPPKMTIDVSDDLTSIKGAYAQPIQVFADPITNDGTTNNSILLPVVTTANLAEIQSRYPDLGITNADVVQYSNPHGYTDTADFWEVGNWNFTNSGITHQYLLKGGHDIVTGTNNGLLNSTHTWRPYQKDTDFMRYKTVTMKVLLEPSVVNQLIATQDNPAIAGTTIRFGSGQSAGRRNPLAAPQANLQNIPGFLNAQPLGNTNISAAGANNNFAPANTITIGSGNAYLDDSGSTPPTDTVTFIVSPTSTVMAESDIQLNLPPLYSNAVVIVPSSFTNNGSGSYSFDITSGSYVCPGSSLGLTWSLTITHPNDSAAYDDTNINFDTCAGTFTGGPRTGNNNNNNIAVEWEYYFSSGYGGQARQISYYDSSGVQQYEMVYYWNTISNPVTVCQENGIQYGQSGSSLISKHPTLNHNITANLCV